MPHTVEHLVRDQVTPQMSRYMYGYPWIVDAVTAHGVDIYYGPGRRAASIPWMVMERVPTVLADQGWVEVEPGGAGPSLGALTGGELPDEVVPYMAAVLALARVLDLDEGPPMRVRLLPDFGREAPRFPSDETRAGNVPETSIATA